MKTIVSTRVTIKPGSNILVTASEMIMLARFVDGPVVAEFTDLDKAVQITVHPEADVPSVVRLYQSVFNDKVTT